MRIYELPKAPFPTTSENVKIFFFDLSKDNVVPRVILGVEFGGVDVIEPN